MSNIELIEYFHVFCDLNDHLLLSYSRCLSISIKIELLLWRVLLLFLLRCESVIS